MPNALKRFVALPSIAESEDSYRCILLEQVVSLFIDRIFPGYEVINIGSFRVIRDSDLEIEKKPKIWCGISKAHSSVAAGVDHSSGDGDVHR